MKERKNGHTYLKRLFLAFYIPFAVNIPVAAYVWHMGIWPGFQTVSPPGLAARNLLLVMTLAVTWVIWMVFQIMPKRKDAYASWRVTIMEGGRCLCYTAIYGIFVQVLVLLKVYPGLGQGLVQKKILWAGGIYSADPSLERDPSHILYLQAPEAQDARHHGPGHVGSGGEPAGPSSCHEAGP